MTQQRHNAELAARLCATPGPLIGDIVHMGQSLSAACTALARNPGTGQADILLAQLNAAGHAVSRLRAAMAAGGGQS